MVYAICAVLCGGVQCLLLQCMTLRITNIKQGSIVPFVVAKLLIYAGGVALCVTIFREHIVQIGIGFAAGLLVMLVILFTFNSIKNGGDKK